MPFPPFINSCRIPHSALFVSKSSDDGNKDAENDKIGKTPSDDGLYIGDDVFFITNEDDTDEGLSLSDSTLFYVDEDEDDDDIIDTDPYAQTASSEFTEDDDPPKIISGSLAKALARQVRQLNISPLDWGGALSTLRSRVSDIEEGKSTNPSYALFRSISRERPNEAIGRFVRDANPEVVAAMTGAVGSLLGSLSNPAMGIEVIVQASSEKLANLCFQLMMTGYMFRNAEYVIALKSLMNIRGVGATLEEYRAAFRRLDTDGNGYLERDEIEAMLSEVYEGKPPAFETTTFLEFFDSNNDGRISWEEFEKGFGVVTKIGVNEGKQQMNRFRLAGSSSNKDGDDDDEEETMIVEPAIAGTVQVELEDGRIIEVDAQEYMNDLKQQALELKMELAREKGIDPRDMGISDSEPLGVTSPGGSRTSIASYIASLQGDVKSLTQGISPEVVESMKMLIDFVLEGGPEARGGGENYAKKRAMDKKKEMELPGSALQQLALWQLVIGYRLRETEATGEWRRMLE
ncbi:hypothetical protein ACHAXA_002078 [Cyclostephanos tholiformis]|uniref:EF-hand domain-containing protein n=1 Tax=Cyclostephanos tholiformis TaxID=382380 RepID=A0ABD3ST57_9STRA